MHLKGIRFHSESYPNRTTYPFNLSIFQRTQAIRFRSNLTFLIGENGTGKSTLLEAIAHGCGFQIWRGHNRTRYDRNPFEAEFYRYITLDWQAGRVPGSFFASDIFRNFARNLDEWASMDPGLLSHFGGKSLMSQSHGQSLMSLFRARYRVRGLYLLDEPETALSPKSQLELLSVLSRMSRPGHAQFIVASHSPILLACPGADILSFDQLPVRTMAYEETEYYKLYKAFLNDRERFVAELAHAAADREPAADG